MYICAPTLIYLVFAITQIFIDTFQGVYNTAFMKTIVMILFSLMLNLLCMSGMSIISWIIVLVPFLFMSVIVTILLVVFGLDPSTGEINNTASGNLIFSTSSSNSNDDDDDDTEETTTPYKEPIPNYSSDPQYESYKNILSCK